MTHTLAGRRETAVTVLFGSAKGSPAEAAERALGPGIRADLGVLAHLPGAIRKAAAGAVIAAAVALLDFNLIDLLVEGWREHHDLTEAARRTLAAPESTELVGLATHRITVSQRPSIDIILNGDRVATVELELTLTFDISGAVAGLSAGKLTALHSGRCDVTAALAIHGAEALRRQRRIELPGVIALEQGIRLLPERDYDRAAQAPATAGGELAAAGGELAAEGVSVTETMQIAAISSEEESTATQPAITPLPWLPRDRNTPG